MSLHHPRQELYRDGAVSELNPALYESGAEIKGHRVETIQFNTHGRNGVPINTPELLDEGNQLAFRHNDSLKTKASLRFGVSTPHTSKPHLLTRPKSSSGTPESR